MDLDGFRRHLHESRPILAGWGAHVEALLKEFAQTAGITVQISSFRVKEVESAIGKIARKNYSDPLNQMTDLVGVRIVVLLSTDVDAVCTGIQSYAKWSYTKDRDPIAESQENPEKFGYQSWHYVVRSNEEINVAGAVVPKGIPCEIQVRTLMQHAYAELVHDSLYKAVGPVPHKATRYAASSMALIETADHLFCETMRLLQEENTARNRILADLKGLYTSKVGDMGFGYDDKLNLFVLDHFRDRLPENVAGNIEEFLERNRFVLDQIRVRAPYDPFWLQPVSLLAYWLVERESGKVFEEWPLASSHDALEYIFSDLGKKPH